MVDEESNAKTGLGIQNGAAIIDFKHPLTAEPFFKHIVATEPF
jgi:hypothetical protein